MTNAVILVSKLVNKVFRQSSLEQFLRLKQNKLQSSQNRTANAVKPVSKPANERFRPYIANCS